MGKEFSSELRRVCKTYQIFPEDLGYGDNTVEAWFTGTRKPSEQGIQDISGALARKSAASSEIRQIQVLWAQARSRR